MRYASINRHNRSEQSRGDDLESLWYMLIYFVKGFLPRQGVKATTREEKEETVTRLKTEWTAERPCPGLPSASIDVIDYTRSLQLDEVPKYGYLRGIFR